MHIDEYQHKVIELLRAGNAEHLKAAAACVLYCSENGIDAAEAIDIVILGDSIDSYF